ncbi:hypothetical protein [Cellulomonas terrae]|uniref:Uncharacterized protein n=1 Tax=Cellulomonas terrae TaxID=311234 RepID=A0A511JMT1_9CELL|nr:hypothetical protein [Cellulomonas terrae]GEL98903.1 hypothetical protein CTE05_24500 [Cellulomonas terrae]
MPSHDLPDDAPTLDLTPDQLDLVGRIAQSYAAAAPAGWVRIVARQECSVGEDARGIANVRVVVVETPDGLVQEDYSPPRDLHFQTGDMLRELAAGSPTQTVVLNLVVDRDGTHRAAVTVDVPRVLVGIRDETSSEPVHDYLERNRAELTALLR